MEKLLILFAVLIGLGPIYLVRPVMAYDNAYKEALASSYSLERTYKYGSAIEALAAFTAKYPQDFLLQMRLAYLFYLMGKWQNSLSHYENAKRIVPSSLDPYLGMMSVSLAMGDFPAAAKTGRELLDKDPLNYYGHMRMIYALNYQKKFEDSLPFVETMLNHYPLDIGFLELKIIVLGESGKKASKDFDQAMELLLVLSPKNPTGLKYLAGR